MESGRSNHCFAQDFVHCVVSRCRALLILTLPLMMLAPLPARANGVNSPIGNGQIVSGTVTGTGIDTYTFQVNSGDSIFVSVSEVGTHSYDPAIALYNPGGTGVTGTYNGYNSNLRALNAVAGTWSVQVSVWQGASHPNLGGGYTLTAIIIPGVSSGSGSVMSPGVSYPAFVYRGSVNIFTFNGIAGSGLTANITVTRTSGVFDEAIQIYGPNGTYYGGNYGASFTYRLFTGTLSGTYTVLIYRWGSGDGTNTYTVSVSGDGVGAPPLPSTDPGQNGDPSTKVGVCPCGDPININSGNLFERATDYETAGANKLSFARYYNSQAASTLANALGANWRSTYDRYLVLSQSSVIAERADGQQLTFAASGPVWINNSDIDLKLSQSGATWTLTDHDDTVETYTAITSTEALLTAITLRNGYTQTLSYSGTQLESVTDSYSRSLTLSHDGNGLLTGVTTPDGTTAAYGYQNSGGMQVLKTVTYPTSPATSLTYLYEFSPLPSALTGVIDETGNRYATWSFDSGARALSSQTGTGATANIVMVSYDDAMGNRTVTNALGQQEVYKFTSLEGVPKVKEIDRLATATTAAGTRTFTYDANGYLASETDWDGNSTHRTNNSHGEPTSITEGYGSAVARTTTVVYDKTFVHLPATITQTGIKTTFVYDAQGNALTKTLTDATTTTVPYSTKGQTRTWTYTWSNGLLASVQNPRADVTAKTTFNYGSDGALTSIVNAANQTTNITQHTGGGLPLTIVDPNNVTTTLAYDARQRLSSSTVTTSAGARKTSYTYNTGNDVKTVTLPDGSSLTNIYDGAHRLTRITDKLGNQQKWTLDANGDATQRLILDSGSNTKFARTATFDALGRKLQDTSTVTTKSTTFVYDNNGNALTVTDPLNHPTAQLFDALNRVNQITAADGGITKFVYDTFDRPTTVTAPVGTTIYVYDGFGDVIQQKSPDSGATVYHYDEDGNLTQKTLAGGEVSNYTYDALDRILTTTYPADSNLNVSYTYDQTGHGSGIGRLTSLTDAAGSLGRIYDQRGNLLTETRVNGTKTLLTRYSYNAASRMASITYPSNALVTYTRDAAGRIAGVNATPPGKASAPVLSGVTYVPFGPTNAFIFGNGVSETRAFDLDYRLGNVTDTGSGSALVQKLTYGFDYADNILTIADGVNAAHSQAFGYDAVNRLTGAAGTYGSLAYTYDKNGNRLTQKIGTVATTYGYAPATNRVASFKTGTVTTTISTNTNGNITSIPPANSGTAATFSYNAANQLASVTGTPLAATFLYDAFGQRFSKANPGSNPSIFSYGQEGGLLEENNNNGFITDYIYANGRPVATLAPATGKLSFIHTDRLGTPQLATDSTQSLVWSTTYQPFGTTGLINSSITQNVRLAGQYADVETGFNHNGFRDYIPNLGRYLESDQIGLAGGLNTYGYVYQNPTQRIDPQGLSDSLGGTFAVGLWQMIIEKAVLTPRQFECVEKASIPCLPVDICLPGAGMVCEGTVLASCVAALPESEQPQSAPVLPASSAQLPDQGRQPTPLTTYPSAPVTPPPSINIPGGPAAPSWPWGIDPRKGPMGPLPPVPQNPPSQTVPDPSQTNA